MTLSEKERLTLFSLSTPQSGPQLIRGLGLGLLRGAMQYAVLFKLEVLGLVASERLDTGARFYSLTDTGRLRLHDEMERGLWRPPPVARVHRDGITRWLARVWRHR